MNEEASILTIRLLKYDIFASPLAHKPSKGYIPKLADRSLTSLLKYKNETIKQPIHSKIFKPYGEESEIKTQQNMYSTAKLSYSSSVKNINKFPEVQLDPKAVKLLGQGRHFLRSDYQTKRKFQESKKNQHIRNHSSDYLMQNIQLKFCEKSVKKQYKANLIFFKKTRNIPAQIQILRKEEEKKSMPETKNDFFDSQQRKIMMPASKQQQHTDHSMFSSTFRDNFLKSQRSNIHPKPTSQEKSTRQGHKKTQSVQTQSHLEEANKEVPLFGNNYQPNN